MIVLNPQLAQAMVGLVEIIRHPALAMDPALERHTDQIASEIVAPTVVDAGVIGRIAVVLTPHGCAAMRATINKAVNRAVIRPVVDHRRVAQPRRAEIAGIGDFRFKPEEQPGRPAKDARHLTLEGVVVVV